MPLIIPVRGHTPKIGARAFIAEKRNPDRGEVTLGEDCSVWFTAVVRGDVNHITCGDQRQYSGRGHHPRHVRTRRDDDRQRREYRAPRVRPRLYPFMIRY